MKSMLLRRLMPEWEEGILRDYSRASRQLAEANKRLKEQLIGVLEYEHGTKRLRWYHDKSTLTESISWQLRGRDLVMTNRSQPTRIEEEDIVMIGLWAANRAAMWIGAQDSSPLLKFVEDLDTYTYVL